MAPKETSSNSKQSGFMPALENLRVAINEVAQYGSRIKTVEELQKEKKHGATEAGVSRRNHRKSTEANQ
jgi:hypothetical protein